VAYAAKAGSRIYANGRRDDMSLNTTVSFDDAYAIMGSIVLLFLLKDEIFLFATWVQASCVYSKYKYTNTDEYSLF